MRIQTKKLKNMLSISKYRITLEVFLCLLISSILSYFFEKSFGMRYVGEFHDTLELICIFIAISAFLTFWNTTKYRSSQNYILTFGFLIIAVFDILHTYFFSDLNFYPLGYNDLSAEFSILGRITLIFVLILTINSSQKHVKSKWMGLGLSIIIISMISLILFKFPNVLTLPFITNFGETRSKIIFGHVTILFYLIGLYKLVFKVNHKQLITYKHLFIALLLGIPTELCFSFYKSPDSFLYICGHVLKIIRYYYIYKGIFVSSVTEPYKQIEKMMSEDKIKGAFDYVNIGVAITDLSANIISVNKYLCKMVGYTESELLNLKFQDITHKGDKYTGEKIISKLVKLNTPGISFDKRYIHKLGHEIWVSVTESFAYDENNDPLYVVTEIQDISSKKKIIELQEKIENDKKILQETLELDKFRTEFFANLSHELRTPLNVIIGASQLTEFYIYEKGNDSLDHLIKNNKSIKQNSRRLLRLVNNLIDTTKIDSEFFELRLMNINIVNSVEDITLSVVEYTRDKKLEIIFDTDIEEKIIACDPYMIERIMLNLLSNAIKFTDEGGSINVNIYDDYENVIISIKDTGIGIPKDKQDLIFERFRQVDKSFTRNQEGSGIGLSLVKSLVELHGGKIEVFSNEGKGSEFIITLPTHNIEVNEEDVASFVALDRTERVQVEFSDIYTNN